MSALSAVALSAAAPSLGLAQTEPAVPAPAAPMTAASASEAVAAALPASTLVSVTPESEISSKRVEIGQKVSFSVVNDVLEAGKVAIPRGSHVTGTISFKTGKAIGGKSGKFEVTFNTINVRGKDYAMRGTHRQEGKGNTVAAVFGSMLVSGRSAVMQPGDFANAFTAEAIPY